MVRKTGMRKTWLCLVVSIALLFAIHPLTADATYGDGGNHTTLYGSYTFTDGIDADVFVYTTPGACDVRVLQGGDVKIFTVNYDSSRWRFVGWRTHFKSGTIDKANPNFDLSGTWYFSKVDSPSTAYNGTDAGIQLNKEWQYGGTFYVHAILQPIVTVNVGDGVSYSFSGGTSLGNDRYAVTYGQAPTVSYSVDPAYEVTSADASGAAFTASDSRITLGAVERPTSVSIQTRKKQQLGDVDFNGTVNTMDALLLYAAMSGERTLTDAEQQVADINGDGSLNMLDALTLYKQASGV